MRKPKVLFIDLDETLIGTRSGKSTPQGVWDMRIDLKVLAKIKEAQPEYVFIVSNQCGIGMIVSEKDFETKLDYVVAAVKSYIKHPKLKAVEAIYCASVDQDDNFRKPNCGMLEYMLELYSVEATKPEMLMVGDSSGNGAKGDVDLMTANNFGIRYLDVEAFEKTYFAQQ